MRILCTVLVFASLASGAAAKEVFTNKDRKDIRVVEIRGNEAVVQHGDRTKTEVEIGDSLGEDGGTVVEIGKGVVVVERGNSRIRMRPYPGVVREEKVTR